MEIPTDAEALPIEGTTTGYFSSSIPKLKLSAGYQLGLFLVAVAMVLLPGIYLGLMGLTGWGLWWWATHANNWLFPVEHGERRIFGVLLVLYLIPLFVGAVLLLFMFKSFFSRWRVVEFAVPISHEDHPEVFHFLGQLCQALGAPIPSRVDVSQNLGASAGFRAGLGSLWGNDIMLTFGLPLVASMNCREFAAVIAHELAHFTQRWAMRSSFLIHQVQGWLVRAVYYRDEFDASLEEGTNESALGVVLFGFARVMVAVTRGLMWLLLLLGHGLSSYMSRQMEFHADAVASAVAGSEGFVAMFTRLRLLGVCYEQASVQFANKVAPRYPDDLATYLGMLASQTSGELQGRVLNVAARENTHWYESHPAQTERIERVRAANDAGIIFDERPATTLFRDFQTMSRGLTLAGYQIARRGRPVNEEQIFKVEPAAAETAPDTSAEEAAIKAYFGGLGLFLRPLSVGSESRFVAGLGPAKAEQIKQAKALLEEGGLQMREIIKELDAWRMQIASANALSSAGVGYQAEAFPLVPAGLGDFADVLQELERQQAQSETEIEPFEKAAKSRLLTALSLLRTPAIASQIADTQRLHDEVADLTHALGKLGGAFPKLLEMRRELAVFQALGDARARAPTELVEAAWSESAQKCGQMVREVQAALGAAGYPFPHPKGQITLAEYARAKAYDANPARMTQLEVESHLQMLFAVYHRVLGRLVEIALLVEEKMAPPR